MNQHEQQQRQQKFAELIDPIQGRLFAYIHSLVRDLNDADDLYQQTTIVLWKKFDTYRSDQPFISWAFGVARFEVANFLRSRQRTRLYFSDDLNLMLADSFQSRFESELDERAAALSECMDKLRLRDRKLILGCYEDGLGIRAMAERLNRSTHSIHNSLRRIRKSLMQCVEGTVANLRHPS
ncbi:MAG: sigma-70 family RNA polymerase sigma factor [Planctomycetota bacterium]